MTFQTASGAAHPSGTFHLCDRTDIPARTNDKGSSGLNISRSPLCVPAVSLRFLLRCGIGAPVHDRGANATRDFSDSSEAFRSEHSFVPVCPSHFTHRDMAQRVSRSERLSTLPGHVAPDAPSWGALPSPNIGRSDRNERR